MKRLISLLLVFTLLASSCGFKKTEEKKEIGEQIKEAAELGTYDLYYHTIAKFDDSHWYTFLPFLKDTKFWMEYDIIVTVGIDVNKLGIRVKGNKVIINEPKGKVLGTDVADETLGETSTYCPPGVAEPTPEQQQQAMAEAEKRTKKQVEKEKVLLRQAEKRAKNLISKTVQNIGELIDKDYEIEWVEG